MRLIEKAKSNTKLGTVWRMLVNKCDLDKD